MRIMQNVIITRNNKMSRCVIPTNVQLLNVDYFELSEKAQLKILAKPSTFGKITSETSTACQI